MSPAWKKKHSGCSVGHHFQVYTCGTRVQTSASSMVGFALEGIGATEHVAVTAASQLGSGKCKVLPGEIAGGSERSVRQSQLDWRAAL